MTNLFKLSGSPILFVLIFLLLGSSSSSQDLKERVQNAFVFWHGFRSEMTIHELVSYCAPVFWYSADEPMLYTKQERISEYHKDFLLTLLPQTP